MKLFVAVEPRADGKWSVELRGTGYSDVAHSLDLQAHQAFRIVRTERRARRIAEKMLARARKRMLMKEREGFVVE